MPDHDVIAYLARTESRAALLFKADKERKLGVWAARKRFADKVAAHAKAESVYRAAAQISI